MRAQKALPNDPVVSVYPTPLWTPTAKRPTLLDIDATELARQITLLESEIYLRLTTNEVKSQVRCKAPRGAPLSASCCRCGPKTTPRNGRPT